MELLNLTIADPSWKPPEFEVEFFDDEQRKIYRDEISPLTDEDRKTLESGGNERKNGLAADRKRIIIAPVLKIEHWGAGSTQHGGRDYYTRFYLSTKDRVEHSESTHIADIEEGDMIEIHFVYYPNGDRDTILEPTKVVSFKRERPKIEDFRRQVFFKDEIVPLTEDDKEKIKKKASIGRGCAVFFAIPSAAFAVYSFFYSSNKTAWRFVFGGVGAFLAILFSATWLLMRFDTNEEIKLNKKRVITAPVAELFTKTVFGKPTKFYAAIKTVTEMIEREIPAEVYLDLEAGDIIELEYTINPDDETTLREVTKIADAPEENKSDGKNA